MGQLPSACPSRFPQARFLAAYGSVKTVLAAAAAAAGAIADMALPCRRQCALSSRLYGASVHPTPSPTAFLSPASHIFNSPDRRTASSLLTRDRRQWEVVVAAVRGRCDSGPGRASASKDAYFPVFRPEFGHAADGCASRATRTVRCDVAGVRTPSGNGSGRRKTSPERSLTVMVAAAGPSRRAD